ncbi:outer membrane lipoprotein carrier protein LolA [Thermodesulfatator indicus DSM 15286]|uniref:Outer-membrane lipoprotein carrier protein n=1 Tax=Thermodesulfatator indicus (strain DSM 15286 / JCM 11887 / CIR29812) TaxID=667014 RepID=F8ACG9_THEID|nr:outer membrane lipoprotein carrier protein LolA [Thermodesulfatator indicus DSM 15286]
MVRQMVFVLVLCLGVLINKSLWAANLPTEIAQRVEAYYQATKSFAGEFEQEVLFKRGGQVKISKGKVFYKKPGLMRWEYEWPEKLLVIFDGKTIYVYSPKDKQVMVFPLDQSLSSKVTVNFLKGQADILRDFELSSFEKLSEKKVALTLIPKDQETQVQKICLIVTPENGAIKEIWFWDQLENLTKIKFFKIKRNVKLKSSIFHFEPPRDVEIIRQR